MNRSLRFLKEKQLITFCTSLHSCIICCKLFKEAHDTAAHKNSYKSKLYELTSVSLANGKLMERGGLKKMIEH